MILGAVGRFKPEAIPVTYATRPPQLRVPCSPSLPYRRSADVGAD